MIPHTAPVTTGCPVGLVSSKITKDHATSVTAVAGVTVSRSAATSIKDTMFLVYVGMANSSSVLVLAMIGSTLVPVVSSTGSPNLTTPLMTPISIS